MNVNNHGNGNGATIAIVTLVVAIAGTVGTWMTVPEFRKLFDLNDDPPPPRTTGLSLIAEITGGCDPYQVFAQNRWRPFGAAVRTQPNVTSKQVAAQEGNKSLAVDGWVHSRAAYPTNPSPWNSDIWLHLADGTGWVSFAAVRAYPVGQDPDGLSEDGGQPAPTPDECEAGLR